MSFFIKQKTLQVSHQTYRFGMFFCHCSFRKRKGDFHEVKNLLPLRANSFSKDSLWRFSTEARRCPLKVVSFIICFPGDQVCKDVLSYLEGETLNPSSKENLSEFAHTFSAVQDYRNAEVLGRSIMKLIHAQISWAWNLICWKI